MLIVLYFRAELTTYIQIQSISNLSYATSEFRTFAMFAIVNVKLQFVHYYSYIHSLKPYRIQGA